MPPREVDDGLLFSKAAAATETTRLLSSSNTDSTDSSPVLPRSGYNDESLPLASSYEDLRKSVEVRLKDLKKQKITRKKNNTNNNVLQKSQAICILLFGCALSVMLVAIVSFHRPDIPETPPLPPPPPPPPPPDEETTTENTSRSNDNTTGKFSSLPFSHLDPVNDLGLMGFTRGGDTSPPANLLMKETTSSPLPTNAWYQNMLMCRDEPTNLQRVYSIPYMVDVIGHVPGVRVHPTHVLSSESVLQVSFNENFGLTLGAGTADSGTDKVPTQPSSLSHKYTVSQTTELGLTLNWNAFKMSSSIVYGMPFATMIYEERKTSITNDDKSITTILPTIVSRIPLGKPPVVDGIQTTNLLCSSPAPNLDTNTATLVDHELELYFEESDYSWLVVFSEPVSIQCYADPESGHTLLQVVDAVDDCTSPLVIRIALLNSCSTGRNGDNCRLGLGDRQPEEAENSKEYGELLRRHAHIYPGENSAFEYNINESKRESDLIFDWDARMVPTECRQKSQNTLRRRIEQQNDASIDDENNIELITYGLPHHLDKLDSSLLFPDNLRYCKSSIAGPTCVIEGSKWTMTETLPGVGLRAPRPPRPEFITQISDVLQDDIGFSLPDYFMNGAGDTYFSGKMLAKLGRILLVAEEVNEICNKAASGEGQYHVAATISEYSSYCNNSTLVTDDQMTDAIDRLRDGVSIWLNDNAEAPFVYDTSWGGIVNCGCYFNGNGCSNKVPDCPAFSDQGLNFGNGFYNDQHFHYGYHIYAAAILSHFDEDWGKQYYDRVLLLARNIANPSKDDKSFPLFRHKDWFRGFSWASGVVNPPYLNGKNQESSSEAIAAYESVAVYGQVMRIIWEKAQDFDKAAISNDIMKVGQLMTATELRSAQKYWHVLQNVEKSERIYPEIYNANVVGIVWSSMAQFGTWFGRAEYLPYGIQLLPLTPISEARDDLRWANEMYYPFSKGCSQFFQCTDSGWVVLQLAILATVGYSSQAAERVKLLPDDSFTNAGGNGHSRSNTLWYIATRPIVQDPVPMDKSDFRGSLETKPAPSFVLTDCHTPSTCTDEILDRKAGEYTCRERMTWTMNAQGKSQWEACSDVGGLEYPKICGPCAPGKGNQSEGEEKENGEESKNSSAAGNAKQTATKISDASECPACTLEQCDSDLNRCPVYDRTFVCTKGPSVGGCNGSPWSPADGQCESCCELTECQKLRDTESQKLTKDKTSLAPPKCPPCPPETCYGKLNQCPIHSAPFLCTSGLSQGGCSPTEWDLSSDQCTGCCEITVDC